MGGGRGGKAAIGVVLWAVGAVLTKCKQSVRGRAGQGGKAARRKGG